MMLARLAGQPKTASGTSGRWSCALSPRGLLLLGAGLIWIAPALADRRALWLMAGWDVLVLVLAAIDLARLPGPAQIGVTRSWNAPLTLGAPSSVRLTVVNQGQTFITLRLTDHVSPALRPELAQLDLQAGPGEEVEGHLPVHPRARGDQQNGPVAMVWWSPWRLVERWAIAPVDGTVRVYPDLAEGRGEALYLIRSRQIAIQKRRARHTGHGREFESLRDYREGDEWRDLCWPVSARRGRLVTKVYQPERSQAVWILVDAGRLLRARVGERTMLDVSATAALTLAQVALGSGDRVGLLTYGRRIQHRIAPGRGAGHLRALVEALALVRSDAVEADHASAVASLLAAQRRRALMVWLTEIAETAGVPDVIEHALGMTARHLVLFAVMRQPAIRDLAAEVPASASAMYRIAAAQETLDRRDTLLHALRQRAALVVEMSPTDLSTGVVDRYLEARERGLL
jgi:uncharacterized protein (DUF58 family)